MHVQDKETGRLILVTSPCASNTEAFQQQWAWRCPKPGDAAVENKSIILTALPEIQTGWGGCPETAV